MMHRRNIHGSKPVSRHRICRDHGQVLSRLPKSLSNGDFKAKNELNLAQACSSGRGIKSFSPREPRVVGTPQGIQFP